jgi:hypothetical protein
MSAMAAMLARPLGKMAPPGQLFEGAEERDHNIMICHIKDIVETVVGAARRNAMNIKNCASVPITVRQAHRLFSDLSRISIGFSTFRASVYHRAIG